MFSDHLPDVYEKALQVLLEELDEEDDFSDLPPLVREDGDWSLSNEEKHTKASLLREYSEGKAVLLDEKEGRESEDKQEQIPPEEKEEEKLA